jgi:hypothetical protein
MLRCGMLISGKQKKTILPPFLLSSDDESDTVISGSHSRENPRLC